MPTIARPPIRSGRTEATRLRKKSSESRKSSGKASSSACCRSFSDLVVDLFLGDRGAADRDPRVAGERVGDFAADVLGFLVAGGLQGDDEVGRVAVFGDEGARVRVVVADHPVHFRVAAHFALECLDPGAGRGTGDGRVFDQGDDVGEPVARFLQLVLRLDRLGRRVFRPVGIEPLGDRAAEGAGEDREDDGDGDHHPRVALGEPGERREHQAFAPFSLAFLATSASSLRHQSACQSNDSIPARRTING